MRHRLGADPLLRTHLRCQWLSTSTSATTAAGHDHVRGRADVVRPRARLGVRVQPRGGGALLRAAIAADPGARWRTGASPTRSGPTTTSRGSSSTRPTWPTSLDRGARGRRAGAWPPRRRHAGRAGAGARRSRPATRRAAAAGGRLGVERGYADAMRGGLRRAPRRPRRRRAVRRRADEPDARGSCGTSRTGEPAAGARTAEAADGAGAGARRPGGRSHPGRAAHVHPPDGDVAAARGRAAGGRPAARPGARRRPPAAHADPHRRAVRRLPQRDRRRTRRRSPPTRSSSPGRAR